MKVTLRWLSPAIFLIASAIQADAARFPDAVMHRFVLQGGSTAELAQLLGFSGASPNPKAYPLHPNIVHAMAISRNPAVQQSPASLSVSYSADAGGRLVLMGPCLDSRTGSGERKSRFFVTSPTIPEGTIPVDPWGTLWANINGGKLTETSGRKWGEVLYEKKFSSSGFPDFRIQVYRVQIFGKPQETWGFQIEFGMDG